MFVGIFLWEEFMKTCILQLDENYSQSYIWSEDNNTLENILKAVYPDFEERKGCYISGDANEVLLYNSQDYDVVSNLTKAVFDNVVTIKSTEFDGEVFLGSCLKIVEGVK